MMKNFIKILLLILPIFLSACSENNDSDSLGLFSSDETEKAYKLVEDANIKLGEIKKILNENESRLEDLKTALSEKNTEKVKKLSGDIVDAIDIGILRGREALSKMDDAQRLNINDDFKKYLSLKSQSLLKYAEAYSERRELALILRDKYDPNNVEQRKAVGEEFERREVVFLNIMKEAGELSLQANQLAKDANSKSKK